MNFDLSEVSVAPRNLLHHLFIILVPPKSQRNLRGAALLFSAVHFRDRCWNLGQSRSGLKIGEMILATECICLRDL